MQTAPIRPLYAELGVALRATGEFSISPELLAMFRKNVDPVNDDSNAEARFFIAKTIYASIGQNTIPPQPAVFYSTRDKEGLKAAYFQQNFEIRNKTIEKLQHILIEKKLIEVFRNAQDLLEANDFLTAACALDPQEQAQLQQQYQNHLLNASSRADSLLTSVKNGTPLDIALQQILQVTDQNLQQDLIRDINELLDPSVLETALQRTLTMVQLTQIFIEARDHLGNRVLTVEESLQLKLYQHYISNPAIIDSLFNAIQNGMSVNDWFSSTTLQEVQKISDNKFYDIPIFSPTIDDAVFCGRIYNPGSPQNHNWGVNAAWVLGLIHSKVPIMLRSPVNVENQNRDNPTQPGVEHPSAFALEIAIALQAGYKLNYSVATGMVTLQPPKPSVELEVIFGVTGRGLLPTKAEQIHLYQTVIKMISLRKDIVDLQISPKRPSATRLNDGGALIFSRPKPRAPLMARVEPSIRNTPGTGRAGTRRTPGT